MSKMEMHMQEMEKPSVLKYEFSLTYQTVDGYL